MIEDETIWSIWSGSWLTEDEKIWLVGLLTGVRPALTREEVVFLAEVLSGKRLPCDAREENWLYVAQIYWGTLCELRDGHCKFETVQEVLAEMERRRDEDATHSTPASDVYANVDTPQVVDETREDSWMYKEQINWPYVAQVYEWSAWKREYFAKRQKTRNEYATNVDDMSEVVDETWEEYREAGHYDLYYDVDDLEDGGLYQNWPDFDGVHGPARATFDTLAEIEFRLLEQVIRFLLVRDRWKTAPRELRYPDQADGTLASNEAVRAWELLPEDTREDLVSGMAAQGTAMKLRFERRFRANRLKEEFLTFYRDDCFKLDIALERVVRELERCSSGEGASDSSASDYGGDELRTRRLTIEEVLEETLDREWRPPQLHMDAFDKPVDLRFSSPDWHELFAVMREGDELWFCNDGGWTEYALIRDKVRIKKIFDAHYTM